jgi:iron complex outermembrane receptor protein
MFMEKTVPLVLLLYSTVILAQDESIVELEPVVVTAPLEDERTDSIAPVTTLSDDELRMKVGNSIGDTLKNELGISSQSFGPGVGTPVIRGQAGSRCAC